MSETTEEQNASHRKFVTGVVATGIVWTLEDDEGCANIDSETYETEEGEPEIVLCYWSDEKGARAASEKHWPDHDVGEITLSDFMENWCVGMQSDGVIAGTNFDPELLGTEILPLDLLLELFKALKKANKEMSFEQYPSQGAFEDVALGIKAESV